eukprot:5784402-Pleurochrysis_carterae.AAC.1
MTAALQILLLSISACATRKLGRGHPCSCWRMRLSPLLAHEKTLCHANTLLAFIRDARGYPHSALKRAA